MQGMVARKEMALEGDEEVPRNRKWSSMKWIVGASGKNRNARTVENALRAWDVHGKFGGGLGCARQFSQMLSHYLSFSVSLSFSPSVFLSLSQAFFH